jgi:hypothetical protein
MEFKSTHSCMAMDAAKEVNAEAVTVKPVEGAVVMNAAAKERALGWLQKNMTVDAQHTLATRAQHCVRLLSSMKTVQVRVPVLLYVMEHGRLPPKDCVAQRVCGIKACVAPEHLRWVTTSDPSDVLRVEREAAEQWLCRNTTVDGEHNLATNMLFYLRVAGKVVGVHASTLLYALDHDNTLPPRGCVVHRVCGVKSCVTPEHLRWVTAAAPVVEMKNAKRKAPSTAVRPLSKA